MKRDMDLVRKILLLMEASSQNQVPNIEGYSSNEVGHHVYLMMQAGLIDGADITSMDDDYRIAIPTELTWQGHDFLDACRNENIWNRAKESLRLVGGDVPIAVMKTILTEIITKQVIGI